MHEWLATLTDPFYGLVDLFLDSPVAAVTTALVGGAIAAMLLSLG